MGNSKFIDECMTGRRIQEAMSEKGISKAYMAEQMGVSKSTIGKWLAGWTLPDIYDLVTISQILECSIDSLVVPREGIAEYCEGVRKRLGICSMDKRKEPI